MRDLEIRLLGIRFHAYDKSTHHATRRMLQSAPSDLLTFTGAAVPRATYTSVHSLVRKAPRRLSVRV